MSAGETVRVAIDDRLRLLRAATLEALRSGAAGAPGRLVQIAADLGIQLTVERARTLIADARDTAAELALDIGESAPASAPPPDDAERVLLALLREAIAYDDSVARGWLQVLARRAGIPLTDGEARDLIRAARGRPWGQRAR